MSSTDKDCLWEKILWLGKEYEKTYKKVSETEQKIYDSKSAPLFDIQTIQSGQYKLTQIFGEVCTSIPMYLKSHPNIDLSDCEKMLRGDNSIIHLIARYYTLENLEKSKTCVKNMKGESAQYECNIVITSLLSFYKSEMKRFGYSVDKATGEESIESNLNNLKNAGFLCATSSIPCTKDISKLTGNNVYM